MSIKNMDPAEPRAITPSSSSYMSHREGETERVYRFWLGMLYAALCGYGAGALAILSYISLTWLQPHRVEMLVLTAATLLCGVGLFILRRNLVQSPNRVAIFASLNAGTFVLIVVLCVLDSGINSPMTYLYILPMVYLGIGFSMRSVLASGLVGLAGCALLIALNTGPVYGPTNMLQLMTLCVAWVLAILGALNRERQDEVLNRLRLGLETLATTDELTGCLNQRAFVAAVNKEYLRTIRYGHEMALILIDIDYFKQINDQHGHMMGDAVLQYIGQTLRHTARHADIVGRPGGDELALLAPETSLADACVLAERIVEQIKTTQPPVPLTLSIGACSTDSVGVEVKTLFQRADQALYAAKHAGRDRVMVFDQDQDQDQDQANVTASPELA